ncbi:MAG: IclR family transcriptional regulator [Actinomycetes bacterium]
MVTPAKGTRSRPAYAITSVDHALRLAAHLQVEGRITVTDAARTLGVAASTAHRLLSMLVYRDFARKEGREYRVGPVLALVSDSPSTMVRLREASAGPMSQLVTHFDETVTLAIRTGRTIRFIAEVESSQSLRVDHRTGMVFPAHRTSGGLVLLAQLDDADIRALYAPDRLSDNEESPDVESVLRHVQSVREQGFSLNNGLSERGVLAIGHLIRGVEGEPVASLSIAMPASRFEPNQLRPMVSALRRASRAIEARLARQQWEDSV